MSDVKVGPGAFSGKVEVILRKVGITRVGKKAGRIVDLSDDTTFVVLRAL